MPSTRCPRLGSTTRGWACRPSWHHLHGFAAHWDKNTNLAAAFDQWFLNLFPRERPFVFNGGGYLTLSFIPSLATMVLGLLAGGLLRGGQPAGKQVRILLGAGLLGILAGSALGWLGICPVVKRIWTPSWTLYSAGWASLLLAAFYAVIDVRGAKGWAFPLVVVGMNSIAMYCLSHLESDFIADTLEDAPRPALARAREPRLCADHRAVGRPLRAVAGLPWLYRRKLFLRI